MTNNEFTFIKTFATLQLFFYVSERPTATVNCSTPVKLNQESYLTCSCIGENGNPPASVTWYDKDGRKLVRGYEEQVLTLKSVSGKDSGTYKCVAQSYTLSNNKTIELIVKLKCKYTAC